MFVFTSFIILLLVQSFFCIPLSFSIFIDELLVINTGMSAAGGRENDRLWNIFRMVTSVLLSFMQSCLPPTIMTPQVSLTRWTHKGILYMCSLHPKDESHRNFILHRPLIYKTAVCYVSRNGNFVERHKQNWFGGCDYAKLCSLGAHKHNKKYIYIKKATN